MPADPNGVTAADVSMEPSTPEGEPAEKVVLDMKLTTFA